LNPMHGMLFIFEEPGHKGFWMRNTYIPLDIIFIDEKRNITQIFENTEPLSTTSLESIKPIQYVVEVNAGFTKRFGIDEHTRIQWQRISIGSKIP